MVVAPRMRRSQTIVRQTETVTEEDRPEPGFTLRSLMTYENLFWVSLFAIAIVSRIWDIGNRGIHHDESLHAVYSNNLYKGTGYTHDPMMHGPLQFHLIGAMYWLFGATDATARLASAFCGIFVVMSPFFLRRQMGRLTALICSFLLLISPSILYFSRMAREDAIFSGMEMIMLVGLWRFISMRRPADFYIFCAGLALMFTIKETAYLTVAVLAIFFALLFAYQSGYAILGALGGYLAALGGMYLMVHGGMKDGTIPPAEYTGGQPWLRRNHEVRGGYLFTPAGAMGAAHHGFVRRPYHLPLPHEGQADGHCGRGLAHAAQVHVGSSKQAYTLDHYDYHRVDCSIG